MKRSFYHFLMTKRGYDNQQVTQLANAVHHDIAFPKQSDDYSEISNYLELNTDYIPNMDIFDEAWEIYQEVDR